MKIFQVMSTFNEFYRTMLKFINFKLFSEEHFAYPPKFAYRRQASDMAKFYTTNTDKVVLQLFFLLDRCEKKMLVLFSFEMVV